MKAKRVEDAESSSATAAAASTTAALRASR
jgi:hypothetical protein